MRKRKKSTLGNLEANAGILPDARYACSSNAFRNGEITTEWATDWAHSEMDLS